MKKMLAVLLVLALLADGSMAFAGKSYSSGGSRSSGGGGRSYSSGSSSRSGSSYSGRSYSGGSTSGRSYSSGSKPSYTPSHTPSKPSYTPSYTPSKPSYTPPAATGSSGKSYSSGSSSKPYTPSYTPPATSSKPTGKSYSSESGSSAASKPYAPAYTPPPKGKPTGSNFNSGLSTAAKQEESKTRYQAANTPKPTYTPPGPGAKPTPIKADSPQVQTVRRHVTHERYVTYDNRASVFYGGYYGQPMYYHDSFSPFLWGWIMSDAINSQQRATWMYHHQNDMDQARYQAMLAKDARLQAEIDALKAQNVARDPSYVPPQMQENPDLMYNKEFVDASYNPVAIEPEPSSSTSSGAGVVAFMFWTVVILSIGGIFLYFMFVKEY